MTAAYKLPSLHKLALGFIGLALSCIFFSFSIPQAQAAGLTEPQITAILNLLSSFGADATTVQNVNLALHGQAQPGAESSDDNSAPDTNTAPSSGTLPHTGTTTSQTMTAPVPVPGITIPGVTFTATPMSGPAPLAVVFVSNIKGTVLFGDGAAGAVSPNCSTNLSGVSNCATGSYLATHTYTHAGTYTATLTYQPTIPCTTAGVECLQVVSAPKSVTVTITVTGVAQSASAFSFSAFPASGAAPLTSFMTISGASSPSGYSVNFGDGTGAGSWQADIEAPSTYFLSHIYSAAGTYSVTLIYQPPLSCPTMADIACTQPPAMTAGKATVTVTAPVAPSSGTSYLFSSDDLVAAAVMAPFSLAVNSLADIFVQLGIGQ